MFKYKINQTTSINTNTSLEGETIENKIKRITQNNEPISDGAPIIYQERKAGVEPQYDIRTDRYEIALDAMSVVHKTKLSQREERQKQRDDKNNSLKVGEPESTQGTKPNENPAS